MVNKIVQASLELVFPTHCVLCELRSDCELPLCTACQVELQANDNCCSRCAIPIPAARVDTPARQCGNCLRQAPPFDRVIAPWIYNEHMAHLISRWKFAGETRLTPLLASLWMQRTVSRDTPDLLIPIPLHWRRLWRRGFNQSELLCRELRSRNSLLTAARIAPDMVRRKHATAAQSGMNARERIRNLRGAFTVNRACDNLRIAIVDDVLTTGATAAALARVLKTAGARHIEVWCIARTPSPGY